MGAWYNTVFIFLSCCFILRFNEMFCMGFCASAAEIHSNGIWIWILLKSKRWRWKENCFWMLFQLLSEHTFCFGCLKATRCTHLLSTQDQYDKYIIPANVSVSQQKACSGYHCTSFFRYIYIYLSHMCNIYNREIPYFWFVCPL